METKQFSDRALYLVTDTRIGKSFVVPGGVAAKHAIREAVVVRMATRQEAEQGWQNPLHAGWTVQP
jgi:hypothetical protein